MVLDLRLKEDWLSGDNQFLFYTYRILCISCRTNRNRFYRSLFLILFIYNSVTDENCSL